MGEMGGLRWICVYVGIVEMGDGENGDGWWEMYGVPDGDAYVGEIGFLTCGIGRKCGMGIIGMGHVTCETIEAIVSTEFVCALRSAPSIYGIMSDDIVELSAAVVRAVWLARDP